MRFVTALLLLQIILAVGSTGAYSVEESSAEFVSGVSKEVALPSPTLAGDLTLEEALASRRSIRSFAAQPLTLEQAGQLLWAAQGVTGRDGRFRAAPSAGALCPLEVYLVAANVDGLVPGIYHYLPGEHALSLIVSGDHREALSDAAYGQQLLLGAQAVVAIAAVYERTSKKYGERAETFVPLDAGHASQNVLLQSTALGLGACPVGGFTDDAVAEALYLSEAETPLLLIPVGVPE